MNVLVFFYWITSVIALEKQQYTYSGDIDATRNSSTGIITSPGYPGNYPNNAAYTWTLKTGNLKASVSFNFTYFNIQNNDRTSHCQDYLQIKETEPCCYQAMHRCGFFSPFSLTVTGRIITISFASDNSLNAKGFNTTWKVLVQETPVTNAFTTTSWSSDISTKLSLTRTKNAVASTERTITIDSTNWEMSFTTSDTTTEIVIPLTSSQPVTSQTSTRSSVYLAVGFSVVELALIAFGIYIIKKRRANTM
ncbi:blastula protease 10 [Magallana gigas]|uniref:CUB domain-containing protein n=1 Tax=Magallana gigas TaxID=29159 RepID=A0A8W8JZ32_MAGGI